MIGYLILQLMGADTGGTSFTQSVLQILIPAAVAVAVAFITNRALTKGKKIDSRTDIYKVELEQLNKQREALAADNSNLREDLKEELEDCRKLRAEMSIKMAKQDADMEDMKRRINTHEAELFAWRNGLKTIDGYVLVKIGTQPAMSETEKKAPEGL